MLEAAHDFQAPLWERRDHHGLILEQRRDDMPITAELMYKINRSLEDIDSPGNVPTADDNPQ